MDWAAAGRRGAASLPLILAVAFALRLDFVWQYAHRYPPRALAILPFLFEPGNVARSLALGQGFSSPLHVATGPTAWVAPLYPLLLAALFRAFGVYTLGAFIAAALLNIAAAALVCIPLYAIGRQIGGAGLGAGAAWLWAVFPNAILLPVESMWGVSLATLLAAIALWLALRLASEPAAVQGGRPRCPSSAPAAPRAPTGAVGLWAWFGLLWALILMTDPALLSLLPLLLAWIAYRRHRAAQSWRTGAAVCLVVIVAGCLPWTWRNRAVLHALIPLRSDLGLALWLGNNPQAGVRPNGDLHPINNTAERAAYVRMGEVAYMRAKRQAAVAFLFAHPRQTAGLLAARVIALWSGGARHPWRALASHDSAWFRFVLLFNLVAAAGALAGIAVLWRRQCAYAFPLAIFPLVYPCAYYLTGALPRYRLPADPEVLLLTAVALGVLLRSRRGRAAGAPHPQTTSS